MTMLILKKAVRFPFPFLISLLFCLQILSVGVGGANAATALNGNDNGKKSVHRSSVSSSLGLLVRKNERESLVSTENGEISAVEISDMHGGSTTARPRGRNYHLQFITLEPNALFLPVLLHRDMVFYVHTGSGRLSWVDEGEMRRVNLQRGDVYRLPTGSVFFLQSNLEQERQKLRIYSIFTKSIQDLHEPSVGAAAYSSVTDLVLGFDKKTLQSAFNVPEEVMEEIRSGAPPQAIVHAPPKKGKTLWQFEAQFMKALLGNKGNSIFAIHNKKTKTETFNILKADPDFQNCNGWSLTVTKKKLPALRGSIIGLLMVNLTKGSMMGPHWNPMGSEISIVTQGRGIVRVVCSSSMSESECKNTRFRVEEGDVFVAPRFHAMAQTAFNNDSLVFVGFSTTSKKNYPQFLVGKTSVLQTLDKEVVAASFNVTSTTISQLLAAQGESIILECTSCAEEEERKMEEKEEARRREEEEAKKREEEKRREEEEAKREEEEKRRKEEEEEARKREEEEARRREEEERRKEEEEQARRREEEEARKREKAQREEEERRQEEEEAKRREEEEEARREEEEERRHEEEETKRREEERRREEEAKRREEEEEERRQEERRQEEEAKRREEEEEERRQEEEAKRREEEEGRRRREAQEEEEEETRREKQKKEQAEKKRGQKAAKREEEEARRQEQERKEIERQEKIARKERERQQEEEEARRQETVEKEKGEEEEKGGGESEPKRVLKKLWKV